MISSLYSAEVLRFAAWRDRGVWASRAVGAGEVGELVGRKALRLHEERARRAVCGDCGQGALRIVAHLERISGTLHRIEGAYLVLPRMLFLLSHYAKVRRIQALWRGRQTRMTTRRRMRRERAERLRAREEDELLHHSVLVIQHSWRSKRFVEAGVDAFDGEFC